jgi:hypothetical protein
LNESALDEIATALLAHAGRRPSADVKLVAICELESVNLLRDKERLPFQVAGLTVVWRRRQPTR